MPLGLFGRLSFSDPKKSTSGWFGRNVQAPPREKKLGLPRKPIVPLDKVEWSQADIALVSEEGAFFW
jgi:hypothetical protein